MLELLQRVVLDLADALARDAERPADLLERLRRAAVQAEAERDDLALAERQRVQRLLDVLPAEAQLRRVERALGRLVLDEVAEARVLLLADRLLEADRELRHAEDLAHLLGRHLELFGDLFRVRLAAEALDELTLA